MTAKPPVIDLDTVIEAEQWRQDPHQSLWNAVLLTLIFDAVSAWDGKRHRGADPRDALAAFEDLIECGPMTRHCCAWADLDPEYLSAGFVRWCENHKG